MTDFCETCFNITKYITNQEVCNFQLHTIKNMEVETIHHWGGCKMTTTSRTSRNFEKHDTIVEK
jgi:hypothetical protein